MKTVNKLRFVLVVAIVVVLAGCTVGQQSKSGNSFLTQPGEYQFGNSLNSNGDLIGRTVTIQSKAGDTLNSISTRFDVGIMEMRHANPRIGYRRIKAGSIVVIPTQYVLPPKKYRKGIVINIAELRLYYFSQSGDLEMTFPIALGRKGWSTPIGHTYVVRKQENPPWNVPKSIREYTYKKTGKILPAVVLPGKDNPLGYYAIYLGLPGYLIHGNNNPASIGRLVSSGCIRLHNKDIAELYQKVGKGTLVHIIYYPNKAGWAGNYLYLESHYPISHEKKLYAKHALSAQQVIDRAIRERRARIDWNKVRQVVKQRTGIPTIVGASN